MWSILYCLRNNPEKLKWSQRRRGLDDKIVDEALKLDKEWRKMKTVLDKKRYELNVVSRKIAGLSGEERKRAIEKASMLRKEVQALTEHMRRLEEKRNKVLLSIPNIIHETVPMGRDESDNVPIRFWGRPRVYHGDLEKFLDQTRGFNVEYEIIDYKPLGHADYVENAGLADIMRAAKVAGARFYYLYDDLVWLDLALIMYALDFLAKQGFKIVEPPFMLKRKAYEGVISFEDFEDMIYKIEDEDLYLIATSEHPLAALHMNETLPEDELPILYAGVSPCFRKEAGAHGRDTKGIFRVHQFNKVEQFVFAHPEESWEWHERLIENAEKIWQGLGIPYRIVNVCSGDLGAVAAKKYDLEAWMPAQARYREMVSCSNVTDYQSYRLGIKYAKVRGAPAKGYVHTLNSTAIATSRAITAIVENFQEPDGTVVIPKVLRSYLEIFKAAPKEVIEPKQKLHNSRH
ncbi:MAG: serine--tRNA ligase [Thermoprotei archaeon]|nr:MAG: serine--tRNA ligase [Thermoprotei archaeon]